MPPTKRTDLGFRGGWGNPSRFIRNCRTLPTITIMIVRFCRLTREVRERENHPVPLEYDTIHCVVLAEMGYPGQTTEERPRHSACLQPLHNMLMPVYSFAATMHSSFGQGRLFFTDHRSTIRYPPAAASIVVPSSHRQPLSRQYWTTPSLTAPAAAQQTFAVHGQPLP